MVDTLDLSKTVKQAVNHLLTTNSAPDNLHALLVGTVERSLYEVILEHTNYNQTETATLLGVSRTTLRTKMKHYHLIK